VPIGRLLFQNPESFERARQLQKSVIFAIATNGHREKLTDFFSGCPQEASSPEPRTADRISGISVVSGISGISVVSGSALFHNAPSKIGIHASVVKNTAAASMKTKRPILFPSLFLPDCLRIPA